MKKALPILAAVLFVASLAAAQQPAKKLKVFISVDMEGISGLINWDETSQGGPDYPLFRKLMTQEASAAVEGVRGAARETEIVVRDAHGSARNILPDELSQDARLIREWNGPLSMMEGIDKTFDAVVFIGNHARAGTPNAVLKHTMSLGLFDVILNGVRLPEAAWNAAIAGYFDVPVVFLSGDSAICKQIQEIIGPIETIAVKDGIGKAASMIQPIKARQMITEGVEKALRNLAAYKPYKPTAPYKLEIVFTDENQALRASWIPGAVRTGERSVAFTAADFMDIIKDFRLARL